MAPTYSPIIRTAKPRSTEQPVELGMVVEDAQTGYVGAVVRIEYGRMELEDRHGRRKPFPIGPGYLIDGRPVILTAPRRAAPTAQARTASGSVAVQAKARVALASRIYVEGRHDAELVEQVWGDDLRVEGVVVEYLGGVDDLVGIVEEFRPGPGRRLGVLVDHLVAGSKEARIASQASSRPPWPRRRAHTGRRPSVHRHLAGGQAGAARRHRPGRWFRVAWTGSTACARPWAGRTASRPTSRGRGSGSGAGCGTGTTSSPHSSAESRN